MSLPGDAGCLGNMQVRRSRMKQSNLQGRIWFCISCTLRIAKGLGKTSVRQKKCGKQREDVSEPWSTRMQETENEAPPIHG